MIGGKKFIAYYIANISNLLLHVNIAIILLNSAKENLYTGEVRRKSNVGIFFYSGKSGKM